MAKAKHDFSRTRTFHLPMVRDDRTPPKVTIVMRQKAVYAAAGSPAKPTEYELGYAVCSNADQFEKRRGRLIALSRLNGAPIEGTRTDVLGFVYENVLGLIRRREIDFNITSILDVNDSIKRSEEKGEVWR